LRIGENTMAVARTGGGSDAAKREFALLAVEEER
jgi:hypothetical protein